MSALPSSVDFKQPVGMAKRFLLYLLRKIKIIISIVLIFGAFHLLNLKAYENWDWAVDDSLPNDSMKRYERDQTCQFPILDPFDPSIMKFVEHPEHLTCKEIQPEFTYMSGNTMFLNSTLVKKHNLKNLQVRKFWRPIGSDMSLQYAEWKNVRKNTHDLDVGGVEVKAQYDEKKAYRQLYASVKPERLRKASTIPRSDKRRLGVLIFGVDSISKSNFVRNLPLTYDLLMNKLGGWVFNGYSKIDDNTFPNMVALLTGYKVTIHGSELPGDFQHDHVDNWPFIWKNYSEAGYVTMEMEEQPGIFSYKARGFRVPPTNVYMRPYGLLMNNYPLYDMSSKHCFGNAPESAILLDAIKRFMDYNRDRPLFMLSFLWKLSHDFANKIEALDKIFADWFESVIAEGFLDNTAVFVMSDHGNRFDKIRSTLIGRYEERMPFLYLHLPKWFRQENPHVLSALRLNSWRLVCQYDLYETLVDVVTQNYGQLRPTLKNRGVSLFREVPKNRTCKDVEIPYHFCVCQIEEALPVKSDFVENAAKRVVDEINAVLVNHTHLCAKLRLGSVENAQRYQANERVLYNNRWHWDKYLMDKNVTDLVSYVRVTVHTEPDGGLFEALVQATTDSQQNNATSFYVKAGDISRINAYGEAGICIGNIARNLEKFCYCK